MTIDPQKNPNFWDMQYLQVIDDLTKEARPRLTWSKDLEEQFLTYFRESFEIQNAPELKKALTLLIHQRRFMPQALGTLTQVLSAPSLDPQIQILALNAARFHLVAYSFQMGKRLEGSFLLLLENLLLSAHAEVVEWALRTLEECGPQARLLRPTLEKINPPLWQLWNAHKRATKEIITMLFRRWNS